MRMTEVRADMTAHRLPARRRRRPHRWKVRPVRWEDFHDLVRIYLELYDERAAGVPHGIPLQGTKPTLADEVGWFAELYRRVLKGNALAIVAERAGHVVGHCTVTRVGPSPAAENGHVGVLGILVDRRWRGKGVGRALMREALRRSRERFEVIHLGVHASNVGARRLYESVGFVPIGRVPRAVRRLGETVDVDLMAIVLKPRRKPRANR
jgi:ribosomal protein S18 acetylase RimI-like enzyme